MKEREGISVSLAAIVNYTCCCCCLVAKSVRLFVTLWAVALQAPVSMKFSRLVYWSGLPCPSPGDLPKPGIEPKSPALTGRFFITEPPGKP